MFTLDLFMHIFRGRRQTKVFRWAVNTFGDIAKDPKERVNRFIEESIELAQALGADKEQVCRIVNYVYSRPPGDVFQEAGGAALTLLALCESLGISADSAESAELSRALQITPELIRAKQNRKAAAGVGKHVS